MSLAQYIAVSAIIFGAAIIQALFGFGFALISVPLMIFFVDLPVAVVTATAVSTVSCSIQWYESRAVSVRKVSQRLVLSALVGMPFGLWLLINIDERLMKALLGVFVLVGVFLSSREFDLRRLPLTFDYSMGVIAGVLSTSTSTNGPPIVFLLHARHYSPENFRAVLNRVFTILNLLTLIIFVFVGKVTPEVFRLACLAIPMMGVGVWLGIRLRSFVNPDHFRNLVLVLLLATGLSAIANAIFSQ